MPHDLAHAVTERELGMAAGIFGCIAAGVVFASMEQTAGKRRHDAKVRSARILKARNDIGISGGITSVIHDAVEHGRATETLRAVSNQWQSSSDPLPFPWPTRLQAAVG